MALDMTKATPENFEGFFKAYKRKVEIDVVQINLDEGFSIKTLEGTMTGKKGDYLLIGVNGEKYPCAKEIFEKTYICTTVPEKTKGGNDE